MIGSIIGDVVGSVYEFNNIKTTDFPLFSQGSTFTDDTICTIAFADCILNDGDPTKYLMKWCHKYPNPKGGYGMRFQEWLGTKNPMPYDSFGNGAAMRISPVAYSMGDLSLDSLASRVSNYTMITHSHPLGWQGAFETAKFIYYSCNGKSKEYMVLDSAYDLNFTVESIRNDPDYWDETCQGTVPDAFVCFLESTDFENAIRNAISIGGDSDTIAAIVGGIAQAHYKEIPRWIIDETMSRLPNEFMKVIQQFNQKYNCKF